MENDEILDGIKVIKEYCLSDDPAIGVLRTRTYAHTLKFFMGLVEVAKKDFPDLKDEDIEIVHFEGKRYRGQFGIEFKVDSENVPKEYDEIHKLEPTL